MTISTSKFNSVIQTKKMLSITFYLCPLQTAESLLPEFLDKFINVLLKIVVRMSNNKLCISYPKISKAIFLEEKNVTYI